MRMGNDALNAGLCLLLRTLYRSSLSQKLKFTICSFVALINFITASQCKFLEEEQNIIHAQCKILSLFLDFDPNQIFQAFFGGGAGPGGFGFSSGGSGGGK